MSWFRLYTDLPNCVKLRKLSAEDQIGYVWCLCLHKDGHLVGQPLKDVAWSLRMPEDAVAAMLARLTAAALLLPDRTPTGWAERQFESDVSTTRVRKHRAKQAMKQAGNGKVKRFRNVSETLDETDQNRTEQNRDRTETEQNTPPADAGTPKGATRAKANGRPTIEEVTSYCQERGGIVDARKWWDHYEANGWRVGRNPMRDWRAAVRTWEHERATGRQPDLLPKDGLAIGQKHHEEEPLGEWSHP